MALPQPLPRLLTTEEIVPTMEKIIEKYNVTRAQILQDVTPETATFDNVMLPLAQLENAVQGDSDLGMIFMLQYGAPSLSAQDAVDKARKLYVEASAGWTSDESFYELLQAAREKPDFQMLDLESQHLLDKEILEYKHKGCGILKESQSKKDAYFKTMMKIEGLKKEFQQNISRESGDVSFTLAELDGVPENELAKWKDEPEKEEISDENQEQCSEKKKIVPFANGGKLAILTYAHSPETRKTMFLADNQKLQQNKSLFQEIVKLRAEQARILKYDTHAEFRIEKRTAPSTDALKHFLDELQTSLHVLGQDEIAVMQSRRLKDLKERGKHSEGLLSKGFPPWDTQYYERLLQEEFEIDQLKISEFFPLENTAVKMLGIFASFLGLRFDSYKPSLFGLRVIRNSLVTYTSICYGEKTNIVATNVSTSNGHLRADGSRQYPSTILMCSFPTPTPTSCALLKHRQVVTLFHEMGHGIHDLLAQTKYVRFHGYRLPPDFGEMPSLMLENWCWIKDVLKDLSCSDTTIDENYLADWRLHHPTEPNPPKTIPDELVDNVIKHRNFNAGLYYLRQVSIATFDLQIHSLRTDEDIANLDVQKTWYDLRETIEGMDFSECRDGYNFGTFTHLTAGYDVCYYVYLYCTVMAQDLFASVFASDPFNKEMWRKYRHGVLEYGGSQKDLLGMLENFLGHPPNMRALVEELTAAKAGITPAVSEDVSVPV
ncbi:peptidase family M3 [Penicillium malachiteum]|uniref:Peptidase family M3 n=1 Tax=Penicillium malachiteum TaxID=1324776 RepID=A0AAD6MRA7_9EURO|nr:peptidase family M3 [Penicillium malachiteum]